MAFIQNADISAVQFNEQATVPDTPASGFWRLYFKSDGLYAVDDAGTETGPIGGAGTLSLAGLSDVDSAALTTGFVLAVNVGGTAYAGRALLDTDIPPLNASKIGTGILAIARGGTGLGASSYTKGDWLLGDNTALDVLAIGSEGQIPRVRAAADTGVAWEGLPLDDLSDVHTPTPANGDVLTYVTANSRWEAAAGGGGGGGSDDVSRALLALGW